MPFEDKDVTIQNKDYTIYVITLFMWLHYLCKYAGVIAYLLVGSLHDLRRGNHSQSKDK